MCSSQAKVTTGIEITATPGVAKINGRAVLQPTCNRVPTILERRNSLTKISPKSSPPPPPPPPSQMTCLGMISSSAGSNNNKASISSSIITPGVPASNLVSPKSKSPRPPATKRSSGSNELNMNASNSASDHDKVVLGAVTPRNTSSSTITAAAAAAAVSNPRLERKKSKSFKELSSTVSSSSSSSCITEASFAYSSSLIIEAPGSIAAGRREQMAQQHAQRKMKIAHYGRSKSAKFETHNSSKFVPIISDSSTTEEEKRCSFITQNSDPIYVAYHDEEWGVPVHDDELLFELLVLSGAQVGSDWTTILKKRQDFRDAFTGYEAERVAQISEKQMISISTTYGIDISRVRGAVDNSARILEIKKEFGSFEKYIWAFVNNKPIPTQYKFGHKIPVKTSKSETISKDMVRRGFRFVGPTVVHSFMQAAGLTNDHLITCHRHLPCTLLAARLLLEREEPQTN